MLSEYPLPPTHVFEAVDTYLIVRHVIYFVNQETRVMHDHSQKIPVGTKVQAVWSEDGEW